ncbi:hypothetical protein OUZ56_015954 [Daphnia magna]|uniref:Uncharacterized protein n=1 Tax=Daphnia magna TaxID=35525 RepID=A0ABR0AP82_9CRUS|nr:hypothetical protein OUZ56_015954 [Daphnia magna]
MELKPSQLRDELAFYVIDDVAYVPAPSVHFMQQKTGKRASKMKRIDWLMSKNAHFDRHCTVNGGMAVTCIIRNGFEEDIDGVLYKYMFVGRATEEFRILLLSHNIMNFFGRDVMGVLKALKVALDVIIHYKKETLKIPGGDGN